MRKAFLQANNGLIPVFIKEENKIIYGNKYHVIIDNKGQEQTVSTWRILQTKHL